PWRSRACASATIAESVSTTSHPIARPPILAATSVAASRLTSNSATLAPARASSTAVSAPRPEAAPVTIAACPFASILHPAALVLRFRSSYHISARSFTNFGTKGALQIYDSSAAFGFDVPPRNRDPSAGTPNPPHWLSDQQASIHLSSWWLSGGRMVQKRE